MKSVHLQTTLGQSSEVSRDLRPSAQGHSQAHELAVQAVREAQRASRSVKSAVKIDGKQVETRSKQQRDPKGGKKKKDPGSGEMLDVTCDS